VKRPSPSDLSAVVRGDTNSTLLDRYPHSLNSGSEGGGSVSVKKGSSESIAGLRTVTLKGGGRSIGLYNKDAVKVFKKALSKGKGSSRAKLKKYRNIVRRAKAKPFGQTPLHSSSVNQMFSEVRVDIQPELKKFMVNTFLEKFNRLNK